MKALNLWSALLHRESTREKRLSSQRRNKLKCLTEYGVSRYGSSSVPSKPTLLRFLSISDWNLAKAQEELRDLKEAEERLLTPPPLQPLSFPLLGSENDGGTSCYIDSLIFGMYMMLSAFDPMLTLDVPESQQKLQTSLRLFVNKMRKGQLVRKETVAELRAELDRAGWDGKDNQGRYCQGDVSELFLFLTDIFGLPFLPFQKRLFHGGHTDLDDDRVTTERILALGLTNKDPCFPLHLEEMLVDHFYNSVITGVRRRVDPEDRRPSISKGDITEREEIPVAAWQVLELLPFYSGTSEQGQTIERQTMQLFPESRVIVPIVLKRYTSECRKIEERVEIPATIHFNRFVNQNAGDLACPMCDRRIEWSMRLRSAICHIGPSLSEGHYTAYCTEDGLNWLRLDDLATSHNGADRVRTIVDVTSVFECLATNGYLLFYELDNTCNHDETVPHTPLAPVSTLPIPNPTDKPTPRDDVKVDSLNKVDRPVTDPYIDTEPRVRPPGSKQLKKSSCQIM